MAGYAKLDFVYEQALSVKLKRMNKFYTIIFSIIILASCKNGNQSKQNQSDVQKDSLTTEITNFSKSGLFNGFAVSIVNEKGTLYQKGFGFSDAEQNKKYTDSTIQNIGSISKTFVGLALLKAREMGKLKLDDPINQYLPFKVENPNFLNTEITIRHLATHTSSIVDNEFYLSKNYYLKENQNFDNVSLVFDEMQMFNPADSMVSMQDFLINTLVKNGKWHNDETYSRNKPGEIYEYSNTGTTLAALVLEMATGESFDVFTKKHILEPLKMEASGWHFRDVNFKNHSKVYANPKTALPYYSIATYPDGNFITSVHDLSLYLTELIKGYNGNGTILRKDSYKEFFRPQLEAQHFNERNERNPYNESYNVGIFIGFGYSGYIGHTGGDPGIASMLFFDPKNNIGRILIVNTSFSGKEGSKAFFGIWNLLEQYQSKVAN